jgi:predicted HTH transcriptional regulator
MKFRLFISSVQKEFAKERRAIASYIRKDAVFGKFFDVFLFEESPAASVSAQGVYLKEASQCDVYLGLIGARYGFEDAQGVSPTEREYDSAAAGSRCVLVFVKQGTEAKREAKESEFLAKVESERVRRSFRGMGDLKNTLAVSLVRFLEEKGKIQDKPFDACVSPEATMADLSVRKMRDFVRAARELRGFSLPVNIPIPKLLTHLDLVGKNGAVRNAAILLFGKKPQRYFISSEVKCAQFYGTEVEKPMADYKIYKGDVFELADQATYFVMTHIAGRIGTHDGETGSAPTDFELPRKAVFELIVNAICHRDYASHASVQVMLFADRLEIWNPGSLPRGWTVDMLLKPHTSLPPNELIAMPMYLKGYIEKMGTGTEDVAKLCAKNGLSAPAFTEGVDFRAVLKRKPLVVAATNGGPLNVPINGTVGDLNVTRELTEKLTEKLTETEQKIVVAIMEDGHVTQGVLARKIGVARTYVTKLMGGLQSKSVIRRVGPDKGGYWEVVERGGE